MKISESIILGLIQGLTEFLPVSSSGHLVLFQNLFGIEEATQAFSILLHMATLIAVFVYYWRDIWALIRRPFQRTRGGAGVLEVRLVPDGSGPLPSPPDWRPSPWCGNGRRWRGSSWETSSFCAME